MTLAAAIFFGLLQAATEFLPVSSTAHLLIFGELLGHDLGDATFRAFATIIQSGTTIAVILYFREDLARVLRAGLRSLAHGKPLESPDSRLGWYIVLGTLPAAIAGKLLEKRIEALGNWIIAGSLVGLGLVLLLAEIYARHVRAVGDVRAGDAFLIGVGQAIALVPGSSRSGTTLTAGMLLGFTREAAARFSFLLSVPVILGAGAYKVWKDAPALRGSGWGGATLVATAVAAVAGYAVIHWLLGWLRTRTTYLFIAWRFLAGAAIAILISRGILPAHEAEEHGRPPLPPAALTR